LQLYPSPLRTLIKDETECSECGSKNTHH